MRSIRRILLTRFFELLYGPLVLLHEPLGRIVYGPAWKGRREALVERIESSASVIEVGAGEGYLVRAAAKRGISITGYEPSAAMRRRATKRSTTLLRGEAAQLPIRDCAVDVILVSYPGPWIFEADTWREFARVLRSSGIVHILASGDVRRGRWSRVRGPALRLAYGSSPSPLPTMGVASAAGIVGDWQQVEDPWGTALFWSGCIVGDA